MKGAQTGRFRVLTWNIHKCIGGLDRRYSPERIVELMQHYEPDLALLQEVTHGLPRTNNHNQVELLSDALGMKHVAYHPEHQFRVGGYGNLILSRWPLSEVEHTDLTIGRRKKRGALKARVKLTTGSHHRSLIVFNMHLGLAGSERGEQLQRFIASHPFERMHHNTPLLVGGDLNDLWGTLGPKFLEPHGFKRMGSLQNTFPAAFPLRPLDGLFCRGDIHVHHCAVPRVRMASVASDHLPILADFEVPAE